jgi:hypothetical protein
MVTVPVAMVAHDPPSATARTTSTTTISRHRSRRSARTPPTSENSRQDSDWTNAAPATSTGSRVREATSSGPATMVTPSPTVETAEAVQSLVKSAPRRADVRIRKKAPRRSAVMGDRLEGEEPWERAARTAAQNSAGSRVEARTLTMPRRMRTPISRLFRDRRHR